MSKNGEEFTGSWWSYPPLRNALLAGVIALAVFILERTGYIGEDIATWFYLIAIPLGGYMWAREGVEKLIEDHEIGISMLMIAATVGAGYLGMWDEAAALVVLYGAAKGIEEYTYSRTRHAIRSLLDLAPKEARVIRDGEEQIIPAENLRIGDEFIVLPGESLPTDGVIITGESSLDESTVTGESIPVDKTTGDKVFAASINCQAALTLKATAEHSDNTLSRIIDLVENAQEQKGRAQEWMERFGQRYSPLVLLTAVILIVIAVFPQSDSAFWIEKAVILLVAAAPCALVISLPIAMAAGISGSAKRGILIKGGAHLEHLGVIKTIAFDKTGTLTYGKPRVSDVISLQDSESTLISLAAGLEKYSSHPLAAAILKYAEEQNVEIAATTDSEALFGSGVQGRIDGQGWYLGNPGLFQDMGVDLGDLDEKIGRLQSEGKTVVVLGNDQQIIGLIAMQDALRENVTDVIRSFHAMGIRTVMLTGDNPLAAKRVAGHLGIDDVRAGLKPGDKVFAVQELLREGPVLMVGDGVNDAPALATATCGVAMGAAGTDAAIEAADVALMADDLAKLEEAILLGHKARRVGRQNIIFALIILGILIPAGVGGIISVAMAVLVHEVSELLAVANGLRAGSLPDAV
ncbi:MAG: cation-translocating P-type ATPase [Deltaproteobacteria bacterium]|nr:cation-translocating P-type ATPase [Deltaproteobacteria bacterium]